MSQIQIPPRPSTASRSPPTNEAELVRERREGASPDDGFRRCQRLPTSSVREPAPPVIADAALARALDLLKGLAVLQQSRPG